MLIVWGYQEIKSKGRDREKLFTLMQSHLSIFAFVACALEVIFYKLLPRQMSRSFVVTSSSFTIAGLLYNKGKNQQSEGTI